MSRYITNPDVIHETIDGETIIIDLRTGTYFSLLGSGPVIWHALAGSPTLDEVAQAVEARCTPGDADLRAAVKDFLDELEREQLVALSDDAPAGAAPSGASEASGELVPFETPKLERFTDMQDIILLDPVHKVDSTGWPHAAPAAAAD
jgi:hypothetical protein